MSQTFLMNTQEASTSSFLQQARAHWSFKLLWLQQCAVWLHQQSEPLTAACLM